MAITLIALSSPDGTGPSARLAAKAERADYVLVPDEDPLALRPGRLLELYSPRALVALKVPQGAEGLAGRLLAVAGKALSLGEGVVVAGFDALMLNALRTAAYSRLARWLSSVCRAASLSIVMASAAPKGSLCEPKPNGSFSSKELATLIYEARPSLLLCASGPPRAVIDKMGETLVVCPGSAGLGQRAKIRIQEGLLVEVGGVGS